MSDQEGLFKAMTSCSAVLSLLGPSLADKNIEPSLYADYYKQSVFPCMRKHGIRRIMAMGTVSISRSDDRWTLFQGTARIFMQLFATAVYKNMLHLEAAFEREAKDLDWTVFRIARIVGDSDERAWEKDREEGELFVGNVGDKGWSGSVTRARVTRWIVENMGSHMWSSQMPYVSRQAMS